MPGKKAELEEINRELEMFTYSAAHDLRGPVRTMNSFSQLMKEDYGSSMDPIALGYLERIHRGSERMDTLISDLLSYSRISRAEVRIEPVHLRRVAEQVVSSLSADIKARNAKVVYDIPENILVKGSETLLVQVIQNLLTNAIKFVPEGKNPEIRIRSEVIGGNVRFWIEDNGIGIAPEYHQKIFDLFQRVEASVPGSGIGLAIVNRAINRIQGRIGLESELGQGTRFWVELPTG